ncbi:MAG: putative toxin-antitoxin system toxin component, PIN family [Chlorobium sp.]|nr:putative toxin-antitoxin system toxin component, PIN family [Chlorobium sp.]MCW8819767.1 putative toxin-antitoxin system toxin component, PIN family [Ignavibacteriaceae bacterium]
MRVVCDTNILISGILFGGKPREILHLCSSGTLDNTISPAILEEVENVLLRPKFGLHDEQVYEIIRLFRDTFTLVTPECRLSVITADPDDNRILEAAHAAKANAIISGDAHLLDLATWNNIPIVSADTFLKKSF